MIRIPVRTTNPLNGSQGFSRGAAMSAARQRKNQRAIAKLKIIAARLGWRWDGKPVTITLTRVAPSNGLDSDGLAASLKSVRDGVADGLGFADDNDPLLAWRYAQRRGAKLEWCVEVSIEARGA